MKVKNNFMKALEETGVCERGDECRVKENENESRNIKRKEE